MVQDPVTQPTRHKHRSKPKESRIARLWREMPELFWLALAAAGFVLLTAYSQIRAAMMRAAESSEQCRRAAGAQPDRSDRRIH